MVLGLGPVLGGFSRGCVIITGGFAPLGLSVLVVAKGTGTAALCAGRGSLCLAPSVTSAEMSFPGHCHYPAVGQEKGTAAAARWQPVNLPAQPGEACAGSAELLCPSAQTPAAPGSALPWFPGVLGGCSLCTENHLNVLTGPVVHQWAQGEARGAGCLFQWKDQSQLSVALLPAFPRTAFLLRVTW